MHISPKRRRRILNVHYLSQQGLAQRKIAEQLNVSHATVRADLQLIETHWSDIAGPAADDLLLEQLHLLRKETARIAALDMMEMFGEHITIAEYIKTCDARDAKILALLREARHTIDAIHRRTREREAQPDLYADDQTSQEPLQTGTELPKTVQPESASSQPAQEIVPPEAPQEKIPEKTVKPVSEPLLEPIIEEALELFPQLNGQPPDQILAFLDQLTDPTKEEDADIPLPLYADAAGG